MWEYIINFINIIFSFLTNFSDDMAISYMIKYFCGREIEINKKTWLICLGYETIVFILIKANIISESLIQNIIVILFILIYTYRLKFYKKLFSSFMVFIVNFTFGITLLMVGSALFSQQLFTDEQGIIEGNTKFNTTKDDEINHGFGIYNIKHAVEKYKGNVEIEAKDNMFMLDIVLPK